MAGKITKESLFVFIVAGRGEGVPFFMFLYPGNVTLMPPGFAII
jgi:hypothetical protein